MLRKTLAAGIVALASLTLAPEAHAGPAAAQNANARVALDRRLPAVSFQNVSLRDSIDFLRDVSGVNIHVNWRAIEATGITPDTPVNVKLREVPLRKVLNLILSEASGGVGLAYYLDDGVIEITTREISDNQMFTIVYNVQDLLFEPPAFVAPPDFGLNANGQGGSNRSGRGGGGGGGRGGGGGGGGFGQGGGGGGLFGGGGGGATQQPQDKNAKADELMSLITETVYPSMWVQNGGKATIRFFQGNLVVTAPRSVHEAIGGAIE